MNTLSYLYYFIFAADSPVKVLKTVTNSNTDGEKLSVSLIDPVWELIDPVPDVHMLFCTFNDQFFWGKLRAVMVSWSPRMTS